MKTLRSIHDFLLNHSQTVATAESCTGGLLSAALTSLSGSSAYFVFGAVVYGNEAKTRFLGVPQKLLKAYGAVSGPVCRSMSSSIRKLAKTDYAIGITGIAGPTGAVPGKPVGTVYISVCRGAKMSCRRFLFKGSRESIRGQSVHQALNMLSRLLKRSS